MPAKPEQLLRLGEELVKLAHEMTAGGTIAFAEAEFETTSAVLGLYSKSVKTFQATHLLCGAGFGADAQSLLRCLAETLANIKYIRQEDSERRAAEYFYYTVMQDLKLMNATEQNPGLKGLFRDDMKSLVHERVKQAKRIMGEEEFEKRYEKGAWHGKKIEAVFRDVKLQSLYDLPFRLGARSVHATDIFSHFYLRDDGKFVLKILPDDEWLLPVLSTSSRVFIDILFEVDEACSLHSKELIKSKNREFTEMRNLKGS